MNYEDIYKTDPYGYIAFNSALGAYGREIEKGTKVVPTVWCIQNGVCKEGDEGVLVGYGRGDQSIRVLKKGRKHPNSYWAGFWRNKSWKP